jgi:YfiH family protein
MAILDEDSRWEWRVPGARAVFTSREDGVGHAPFDTCNVGAHVGDDLDCVRSNRARVAALLDLGVDDVAGVAQVHGADVWLDLARSPELPAGVRWGRVERGAGEVEADALVTTREDAALAVCVADCLPIAVSWGGAVAAIHAGWRSLEAGVVEQALRVLARAAGSLVAVEAPRAAIGPALGACCMEVGEEVAARFDASVVVRREGAPRPFLDARADATRRLEAAGCEVEQVEVCTRCDPRCFSHRGDGGTTGRQAVLVRRA